MDNLEKLSAFEVKTAHLSKLFYPVKSCILAKNL